MKFNFNNEEIKSKHIDFSDAKDFSIPDIHKEILKDGDKRSVMALEDFIERRYIEIFGKSPYEEELPGYKKVISEEAKNNLKNYEIEIINETENSERGIDYYKVTKEFGVRMKEKENKNKSIEITECGYCDNTLPPRNYDGDLVCSRCGAEWADAKCVRQLTKREIEELEEYEELDWD